jgi:hypothetical protein
MPGLWDQASSEAHGKEKKKREFALFSFTLSYFAFFRAPALLLALRSRARKHEKRPVAQL